MTTKFKAVHRIYGGNAGRGNKKRKAWICQSDVDDMKSRVKRPKRAWETCSIHSLVMTAKYGPWRDCIEEKAAWCHERWGPAVTESPLSAAETWSEARFVKAYLAEAKRVYEVAVNVIDDMNKKKDQAEILKPWDANVGEQVRHHHGFPPWCVQMGILIDEEMAISGRTVALGVSLVRYKLQPFQIARLSLLKWVHLAWGLSKLKALHDCQMGNWILGLSIF